MICVSIADITQISNALESNAELIELRLDLIKEKPQVIYSFIAGEVKTIATCRPDGTREKERIGLLKSCIELGASFVDLEVESSEAFLNELVSYGKNYGTEAIVSYHNFELTPGRHTLQQMMHKCYMRGGAIAKIATKINSLKDMRNLISLYDLDGRKVVIGMGSLGRITRIMAPYLGAEFTFASTGIGGETAPGQLSVSQLNELFKVIDES